MANAIKWGLMLVGGFVMLVILAGACTAVMVGNQPTSEQGDSTTETKQTSKQSNELEIEINEVVRPYQSGHRAVQPEPGQEFVLVNLTATNNTSRDRLVNVFGFELKDSQGAARNPTHMSGVENRIDSVNLSSGGTVTGNLVFPAPQGDQDLTLIYSMPGASKAIEVPLNK